MSISTYTAIVLAQLHEFLTWFGWLAFIGGSVLVFFAHFAMSVPSNQQEGTQELLTKCRNRLRRLALLGIVSLLVAAFLPGASVS